MQNLFSYGTLQDQKVQIETFGRLLKGSPEVLISYRLDSIKIEDEYVVQTSGETHHPILRFSGNNADEIKGLAFEVTEEELIQTHAYEAEHYKRILVELKSGKNAWVYVAK